MTGETWTPRRYRKQAEFDEYWDMLEYLKDVSTSEQAKKQAKKHEGVDIDKLSDEESRQFVGLGPWGVLAVQAERKAKGTMYGFDVDTGSFQQALSAIPRRQRQIAEQIVMNGSMEEKQRFYDLLPDSERRVLGKFLGADRNDLPDRVNMDEYFKNHFLPDADWKGWNKNTDINDLRTRSASLEGTQIDRPSRSKIEKARAYTKGIAVPRMDHPTYHNIQKAIRDVLQNGGFTGVDVSFSMHPSSYRSVNVDMDLFHDQTRQLIEEMRRETR